MTYFWVNNLGYNFLKKRTNCYYIKNSKILIENFWGLFEDNFEILKESLFL